MVHPAACTPYPAPCMGHLSQPAPLVGMHMLNYISIPRDYILHVQVVSLQVLLLCPAVPPTLYPPTLGEEGVTVPGGGEVEEVEEVAVEPS